MISAMACRSHAALSPDPDVCWRACAKASKFLIDSKRQALEEKSNFLIDSLSCKCTILIASLFFVLQKKGKKSLLHGQKKPSDVTAKWLQADHNAPGAIDWRCCTRCLPARAGGADDGQSEWAYYAALGLRPCQHPAGST